MSDYAAMSEYARSISVQVAQATTKHEGGPQGAPANHAEARELLEDVESDLKSLTNLVETQLERYFDSGD